MRKMIIGMVGSRRRNSQKDFGKLIVKLGNLERKTGRFIKKIVTGDCCEGGDKFAKEIAHMFGYELEVKYKLDPETGEKLTRYIDDYFEFTDICYDRNEEVAKEPLDYLLALVAPDRKGGTENTIRHFKRYHPNWEFKLIII